MTPDEIEVDWFADVDLSVLHEWREIEVDVEYADEEALDEDH